jgi:hypothetical protein
MNEPLPASGPSPATPVPEPPPPAAATPGHFEQWAAKHIEPLLRDLRDDLADARIKAENAAREAEKALALLAAHAANAEKAAALIAKLVAAADPSASPAVAALIPEAEKILAEAVRIGAVLAAFGV